MDTVLLTNRLGGYALLSPSPSSRYEGVFFMQGQMFKAIEELKHPSGIKDVIYKSYEVERVREDFTEKYFMPLGTSSIVYTTTKPVTIDLLLDIRQSYDTRTWGRHYAVESTSEHIIITFIKRTHKEEDESHDDEEYRAYLVIRKPDEFTLTDYWEEHHYPVDEERENISSRFVHCPIKLSGSKHIFSFGFDKDAAIEENRLVHNHLARLREDAIDYMGSLMSTEGNDRVLQAYECSIQTLDKLTVSGDDPGMFAGLPWFFQFWSRDELISMRALLLTHRYEFAGHIIKRYARMIQEDGRIPNRFPGTKLSSADAIGWLFKRFDDFFMTLNSTGRLKDYLPKEEFKRIAEALEISCNRLTVSYMNGLCHNRPLETWMDTGYKSDNREGARIEIQALFLNMFKFMYLFTNNYKYKRQEDELRQRVRNAFWDGNVLSDGADDPTIRPNLFIAAYVYPELLTDEEWKTCFTTALEHLWLPWGGIASIDTSHELFIDHYTGSDNRSYHRGDSWYFLNNMAALVLSRTGGFSGYVDKIVEASTREILDSGVIGAHAEVSSAKEQKSQGCPVQLWSTALYIELINEIRLKQR
ncbi:MAG: amylo-alpha-1,6-glucosidase [Candidatus Woesearchaeota archaeon]